MVDLKLPDREQELRGVFARSLKAVHFAFVSGYKLTEEEASEATEVLFDWFVRLSHRLGLSSRPAASLGDTFLLTVNACQLGRELQLWKLDGAPCPDLELRKILDRDPRDIAVDVLNRLIEGKG